MKQSAPVHTSPDTEASTSTRADEATPDNSQVIERMKQLTFDGTFAGVRGEQARGAARGVGIALNGADPASFATHCTLLEGALSDVGGWYGTDPLERLQEGCVDDPRVRAGHEHAQRAVLAVDSVLQASAPEIDNCVWLWSYGEERLPGRSNRDPHPVGEPPTQREVLALLDHVQVQRETLQPVLAATSEVRAFADTIDGLPVDELIALQKSSPVASFDGRERAYLQELLKDVGGVEAIAFCADGDDLGWEAHAMDQGVDPERLDALEAIAADVIADVDRLEELVVDEERRTKNRIGKRIGSVSGEERAFVFRQLRREGYYNLLFSHMGDALEPLRHGAGSFDPARSRAQSADGEDHNRAEKVVTADTFKAAATIQSVGVVQGGLDAVPVLGEYANEAIGVTPEDVAAVAETNGVSAEDAMELYQTSRMATGTGLGLLMMGGKGPGWGMVQAADTAQNLHHAVTGETFTGKELSGLDRFLAGAGAAGNVLDVGAGLAKAGGDTAKHLQLASGTLGAGSAGLAQGKAMVDYQQTGDWKALAGATVSNGVGGYKSVAGARATPEADGTDTTTAQPVVRDDPSPTFAHRDGRVPASEGTSPAFGDHPMDVLPSRFADPEVASAYVRDAVATVQGASTKDADGAARQADAVVAQALGPDIPPPQVRFVPADELDAAGRFVPATWTIVLPQTALGSSDPQAVAKAVGTMGHEAHHTEQSWAVARWRLARQPDTPPRDILLGMGVSPHVVNWLASELTPLPKGDPMGPAAEGWSRTMFSKRGQEIREEMRRDRDQAAAAFEAGSGEAREAARSDLDGIEAAYQTALREEVSAYDVTDTLTPQALDEARRAQGEAPGEASTDHADQARSRRDRSLNREIDEAFDLLTGKADEAVPWMADHLDAVSTEPPNEVRARLRRRLFKPVHLTLTALASFAPGGQWRGARELENRQKAEEEAMMLHLPDRPAFVGQEYAPAEGLQRAECQRRIREVEERLAALRADISELLAERDRSKEYVRRSTRIMESLQDVNPLLPGGAALRRELEGYADDFAAAGMGWLARGAVELSRAEREVEQLEAEQLALADVWEQLASGTTF